jgi:hypothetical protein
MMYRLSLFSGNFSRALQKTCGSNDFAGPVGSDYRSRCRFAGIHDILLIDAIVANGA